jgi:hypothetical protein
VVGSSKGLGASDHEFLIAVKDSLYLDGPRILTSPRGFVSPACPLFLFLLSHSFYSALPVSGDAVYLTTLLGRIGFVLYG